MIKNEEERNGASVSEGVQKYQFLLKDVSLMQRVHMMKQFSVLSNSQSFIEANGWEDNKALEQQITAVG